MTEVLQIPVNSTPQLTTAEKKEISLILALTALKQKGKVFAITPASLASILASIPSQTSDSSHWSVIQEVSAIGRLKDVRVINNDEKSALVTKLLHNMAQSIIRALRSGQTSTKLNECGVLLQHIQSFFLSSSIQPTEQGTALMNIPLDMFLQRALANCIGNSEISILCAMTTAPFQELYQHASTKLLEEVYCDLRKMADKSASMPARDDFFMSLHTKLSVLEEVVCKSSYSAQETAPWKALLPQITHYAGQMLTKYPLVFAYLMRIAQRANLASASASAWKK